MAANVAVNATISARDAASKNIKNINKALGGLGKTAEGVKRDFQRLTIGIAAVAAGTAAFTVSAIKAAAEDEQATAKLTAALKKRGFATEAVNAAVEAQIQRGQDLAFTDDQVRGSIEASTRFTKNYAVATKIQNVAMELARATGMDLAEATMAVGKAYQGTGGKALKSLGITKKGIKGQEALNAILKKTGGSATAYVDTTAGSMEVLGIKAAELKEQFGAAFLPAVMKLFKALAPELDKFAKWLENKVPAIRAFADNLVNKIIKRIPGFFQKIRDAVPKALYKIQQFIDSIKGIGDESEKILGPGGKITLLVSGIGAALGGLKGVIAANLLSSGVDPLTAYFTGVVGAAITEGVIKGLAAELVTKAIAAFGVKMAAAAAAGSAGSAVAGAATVGGTVATAAGATGATLLAGLAAVAAIPTLLVVGVQQALVGSAKEDERRRNNWTEGQQKLFYDVLRDQQTMTTFAVKQKYGESIVKWVNDNMVTLNKLGQPSYGTSNIGTTWPTMNTTVTVKMGDKGIDDVVSKSVTRLGIPGAPDKY